jgi:predicted nucleic acid-binding protein
MFAVSRLKIEQYKETGSCGNKSLDYAIDLLLKLGEGSYSTSEIALLETVSIASRLGGSNKAETLLRAVIAQEGFRILETRALAYPLSFAFTLAYRLEARDALHLAVAILGGVSVLITSDTDFADGTESIINHVTEQGFHIPRSVRTIYHLDGREAALIEEKAASLSTLSVERAPA